MGPPPQAEGPHGARPQPPAHTALLLPRCPPCPRSLRPRCSSSCCSSRRCTHSSTPSCPQRSRPSPCPCSPPCPGLARCACLPDMRMPHNLTGSRFPSCLGVSMRAAAGRITSCAVWGARFFSHALWATAHTNLHSRTLRLHTCPAPPRACTCARTRTRTLRCTCPPHIQPAHLKSMLCTWACRQCAMWRPRPLATPWTRTPSGAARPRCEGFSRFVRLRGCAACGAC